MSSQAASTSARGQERQGKEKHRIEKVLYRVKTVFKKGGSSKRAQSGPTEVSTTVPTATVTESQPVKVEEPEQPEVENATRIPRSQIHEERAKKLGARFGLEIKPSEWHSTEGDVLRVEKAARMRIHRECHRCHTSFGTGNECPGCNHVRCKKCIRHPPERTESERKTNREKREALERRNKDMAPIIPSYDYTEKIVLKRPNKTGKQDLVYKKVRQRVRRHCHVCNNLMSGQTRETRTCGACGHKRCNDCPRIPNDRNKYPYGYPNDEPGEHFRGVHACHECRKKFPLNAEDGTECPRCSHKKCPDCPRVRPKKVIPEPEIQDLESLQLRWQELTIGES